MSDTEPKSAGESEDEAAFLRLKAQIQKERGLDVNQYKDAYIKRRLSIRMREYSIHSYEEYAQILTGNLSEYDSLMNVLTVNVTEFFRDPSVWHVLEKEILPSIIKAKKEYDFKNLRVWSAGCSSGEEAYSVALLLKKLLGGEIERYLISIYGTDIDEKILEKARAGIYPQGNLKNIEPALLQANFDDMGDGNYQVKKNVRSFVKFFREDLMSEPKHGNFDLIFCRNVMIYFSHDLQKKLMTIFCSSLKKDGYLIVGKTETLIGVLQGQEALFTPVNEVERIYRKASRI